MTLSNWKAVWSRRGSDGGDPADLDGLIRLDGFDVGAGRIEVADWRIYAARIAERLGLADGASVYEVGCGAGAFLFALRERHALAVGGLDYSGALVAAARRAMPDGDFTEAEAAAVDPLEPYDFVVSNGVFHYFPVQYAEAVLARMVAKARVAVAVLEVPDARTRDASEAYRRDTLTEDEYARKYAGLEHTYFAREWFVAQAAAHGCRCTVFDGCVPNYGQNRFRFGALLFKSHADAVHPDANRSQT